MSRKQYTQEEKEAHVKEWRNSGKGICAFARETGLAQQNLWRWVRKKRHKNNHTYKQPGNSPAEHYQFTQNSLHRFLFSAEPILRRFVVAPAALMGNNVFVKLTPVQMTALLMKQILGFVIGPIKILIDLNRHFNGYVVPVDFNMYFHDFFHPFRIG